MSNTYPRFEQRMPNYQDRFHQLPPPAQLDDAFSGALPTPDSPQLQGGGQSGVSRTAGMSIVGKTAQNFEDQMQGMERQLPGNPWSMVPEEWSDQIREWTRQAKTPMKMARQNGVYDSRSSGSGSKKS